MIRFILVFVFCLSITFPADASVSVFKRLNTTSNFTTYMFFDSEPHPVTGSNCFYFTTNNTIFYYNRASSTACLAITTNATALAEYKPVFGDQLEQADPTEANSWCNALIALLTQSENLITFYPTAWAIILVRKLWFI